MRCFPIPTLKALRPAFFIFLLASLSCSDTGNDTNNNGTLPQTNNNSTPTQNSTPTSSTTPGTTGGMMPVAAPPESSKTPRLDILAVKLFRFGWEEVSDATHYQIWENKDGASEFVQVGADISPGVKTLNLEVPLCLRTHAQYLLKSCNEEGCTDSSTVDVTGNLAKAIGYFKAGNTGAGDKFGQVVALSADGKTLAVGAPLESSRDVSDETDNSLAGAGAVYVFTQTDGKWIQQAFIKASNAGIGDRFGVQLSLSDDGQRLAVSASHEDSTASDDKTDNSRTNAGAIYVFERTASDWQETDFLKLDNSKGSVFGAHMVMSGDGKTIAASERNAFFNAELVTVFTKEGQGWVKQAGFSTDGGLYDLFGSSLAISRDGSTVAIGSKEDDSNAVGINGDKNDNSLSNSGAVFLYEKKNGNWEETYFKTDFPLQGAGFGREIALSAAGGTLAVIGDGKESETSDLSFYGYVYLFKKEAQWSLTEKFSNGDQFGYSGAALNGDGSLLALGAQSEESASAGLNGDRTPVPGAAYGAVYIFGLENAAWSELTYVKASLPDKLDGFGNTLQISDDGTIVVGVPLEDSNAKGVDGDQENNDAPASGAVYLY